MLADLANRTLSIDAATARVAVEPALKQLLDDLAGKKIPMGDSLLSFGSTLREFTVVSGSSGRNINIGGNVINSNIHSGDVINVNLQIENYVPPPEVDPEKLKSALEWLSALPTDAIPDVAPFQQYSNMQLKANEYFVGRKEDLRRLAEMLKGDQAGASGQSPTVAITGIGGVGKTQLAVEFVHRYGQYFKGGVFWLNFAKPSTVPDQIALCGSPGRLDLPNFRNRTSKEQADMVRGRWQSPMPCLIVFDNCEDEDLLETWRPVTGGARVIVTSRKGEWEQSHGLKHLPLDVLKRDESIELLCKFHRDLHPDDPDLSTIAAEVGHLPLALHLAGSYLARYHTKCTPKSYLEELRGPNILRHPSLQKSKRLPTGSTEGVARTFDISYARLDPAREEDALGLLLLTRSSHFAAGEFTPPGLLESSVVKNYSKTSYEITDAIKRLVELGLIYENYDDGAVRLHQLIADFVRDVVSESVDAEAQKAVERAIIDVLLFPNLSGYGDSLLPIQAHIRAVTDESFEQFLRNGDYEGAADIQVLVDQNLQQWGDYKYLISKYERIVDKIENSNQKVFILLGLGTAYANTGDLQKQFRYYNEALDIADKLGLEHEKAGALGLLGNHFIAKDNTEAAIGYFEQAINVLRPSKEKDKNLKAKWVLNLGHCYYNQGQTRRAIEHNEQALAISKELKDRYVQQEVEMLYLINRGQYRFFQGEISQAIGSYNQALEMASKAGHKRAQAAGLCNLGECYRVLGETSQARDIFSQALNISKELGLKRQEGQILNSLAELLVDEGRYDQALEIADEGARIGLIIGSPSLIGENKAATARAYLFTDQLSGAHTSALAALENSALLDKHYVLALLGLVHLQRQSHAASIEAFEASRQCAADLINNDPQNYGALDMQCLALWGLAICKHSDNASDNAVEAIRSYAEARAINSDPGVVKRVLRLLELLARADAGQRLREWIQKISGEQLTRQSEFGE
ncbi:MAG: tetratricopeptide repeat protein [Blastocatellia bacterium]